MIPVWSIRPCIMCGASVKCEPNYPNKIAVVCWRCVYGASGSG